MKFRIFGYRAAYGRKKFGWAWQVKWIQDGIPRTYYARSWGEAIAFTDGQIRVMKIGIHA